MNSFHGRPTTVLVVEDVGWIREGMRQTLQEFGYRVLVATDDAGAVEAAERERPDLILTEEELPTLDALTYSAHTHPALQGLPVVFVNPDEEQGTRRGDITILSDFDQIEHLLADLRR
jgi:CheY-like chemotaxis protein